MGKFTTSAASSKIRFTARNAPGAMAGSMGAGAGTPARLADIPRYSSATPSTPVRATRSDRFAPALSSLV